MPSKSTSERAAATWGWGGLIIGAIAAGFAQNVVWQHRGELGLSDSEAGLVFLGLLVSIGATGAYAGAAIGRARTKN